MTAPKKEIKIKKAKRELTFGEELANSASHGSLAFLLMILSPAIAVYSYIKTNNLIFVFSMIVFTLSLNLMFLASTIYHIMEHNTKHKEVTRILDHIFIYVAIAGSYTPLGLCIIGGYFGITLVVLQWIMVIFGILYKSLIRISSPKLTMAIYIFMGWLAILIIPQLFNKANIILVALIFVGGLFYTIGAVIYASQFKYAHLVWHLFVILGALSHLIANVFFAF